MKYLTRFFSAPLNRSSALPTFVSRGLLLAAVFFCSLNGAVLFAQGGTYCLQNYDYAVTNESVSNLFPNGGTWPAGSTIFVSGTLTVNQSLYCNNLSFLMAPSARITVKGSGVTLIASNNTRFYGCYAQEMWLGITASNGAAIQITGGSVVEDAWVGLTVSSSTNFANSWISNSFFKDNMTGIYMGPGSSSFKAFSGNVIKRDIGSFLPPPPGMTYTGAQLHRGMMLVGAKSDFLGNTGEVNKIEGYRYGIYAVSSKLSISRFQFTGSQDDVTVQDNLDGTDIVAVQSYLTVGGRDEGCAFRFAQNAGIISMRTGSLTVTRSQFVNPNKYGIKCIATDRANTPIKIFGNNVFDLIINSTVSGVYIERGPGGTTARNTLVRENIFNVSGGTGIHQKTPLILIDVQGKADATDFVEISQNQLNSTSPSYYASGIRVTGKGDNFQVINENDLNWTPSNNPGPTTRQPRGINASDLLGSYHLIEDNDIVSKLNGDKSFLKSAIHMENNPFAVLLCGNRSESTQNGIFCGGGLGNTYMKRNEIGNAGFGLFCNSSNTMPNQDLFENRWVGSNYVNRGATFEGGAPSFQIFFDPSLVIPDDAPATITPTSGWFVPSTGSNSQCGIILNLTSEEGGFINGSISADNSAENWDARRTLLYKLMRFPAIGQNNQEAQTYLESEAAAETSAWQFAQAEWLFDQSYVLSSSEQAAFAATLEEYQMWSDSVGALDEEQAADSSSIDPIIAERRAEAYLAFTNAADNLETLQKDAELIIQAALATTRNTISTLPVSEFYEENLRDILDMAVREGMGQTLTSSDYSRLRDIAEQCPAIGGISVRRAPLHLPHEEGISYSGRDWSGNCPQSMITSNSEPVQQISVQVVPSPVRGQGRIVFPENSACHWRITDMAGRPLLDGQATGSPVTFTTADIPSGLYILSCRFADGTVTGSKFSIVN